MTYRAGVGTSSGDSTAEFARLVRVGGGITAELAGKEPTVVVVVVAIALVAVALVVVAIGWRF